MEKEAKKSKPITEEVCRQLQLMMAGGADGVEAARLVGISQSRASRIKKAGFDLATYRENDRKEREEQEKRKKEPQAEEHAEEQVPGQIAMDLTPAEKKKPEAKTAEMSEQVKLMRFQAEMTSKMIQAIGESVDKTVYCEGYGIHRTDWFCADGERRTGNARQGEGN